MTTIRSLDKEKRDKARKLLDEVIAHLKKARDHQLEIVDIYRKQIKRLEAIKRSQEPVEFIKPIFNWHKEWMAVMRGESKWDAQKKNGKN